MLLAGATYGKTKFSGGTEFGIAIWIAITFGGFLGFVGLLGLLLFIFSCFSWKKMDLYLLSN